MGFVIHWAPLEFTTILCLDVPKKLQSLLESALVTKDNNIDYTDPYSLVSILIDQVLALYDESVWTMRNHVCSAEEVCLIPFKRA